MKPSWEDDYELPDEIDLTKGTWIRNPFAQRFQELNLVSLDDDVKAVFPDSAAVNAALRMVMRAGARAASARAREKRAS